MDIGDDEVDASEAERLRMLEEAMAPPQGDVVVTVESYDRELLNDLWTLQGEGIEVSERLLKAGHEAGLVWIVIRDAALLAGGLKAATSAANEAITLVERVLKMVQSHTNGDKKQAKTKIKSRENPVEIGKLVQRFSKDVNTLLDVPDSESEDPKDEPESE